MFFSRCRYPLPKFPPQIRTIFKQICVDLRGPALESFFEEAHKSLPEKSAESSDKMVQQLVKACNELLGQFETFNSRQKALAVGAIRYFIGDNDAVPEGVFASGLVDDAKVMNHVLEKLKIEGFFVDIT